MQQKGFVLLLVIALIPLLGMASVVLTSNGRQILTNTRRAALKTHAQLACESGVEWVKKNNASVKEGQPTILIIGHESKNITCCVELISRANGQSVFNLTGYAEDKRFSYKHSEEFILK
jgi:hypothetical protein